MHVAGMYELMKVPYTGAGPLALGTALTKPRVKEILSYHGIPTPKFCVFDRREPVSLVEGMTFPVIVKPSREDASVGIDDNAIAYSMDDLRRRVDFVVEKFEQPALVEEYVDGRELNIAVLGYTNPIALPISEIDFSGLTEDMHKIVSYDAKWVHGSVAYEGTKGVCPAVLPPRLEAAVKALALRCFTIFGCRDYARIDVRLNTAGVPYVLEVNPNPDLSEDAGFARSARTYGLDFPHMIGRIVQSAMERCP